jgi:hypothetical protein
MTIEITRPEIEELIRQRLLSGAFDSVEDVLFDALEVQKERDVWLQQNRDVINATGVPTYHACQAKRDVHFQGTADRRTMSHESRVTEL